MSVVAAFDDIKPEQVTRKGAPGTPIITTTPFFKASIDRPTDPTAYIAWFDPARSATAHYHLEDEFQVIFKGKGKFGRHQVSPYCIHFARAYTSYGPLLADDETGWAFMTLRSRFDPGSQRTFDKLKDIRDRQPWQITRNIPLPPAGPGVSMRDDSEIKDDHGLFVRAFTMAPHTRTVAPEASSGDGQFVVAFNGSLVYDDGREHKALSVAFIRPDEPAFQIQAGAEGMQGYILNMPRVEPRAVGSRPSSMATGLKQWQCDRCAFEYDEARGMPEEGIAAGTRWQDVSVSWSCPDCSAVKSDFHQAEV